jgi:Dolichyl-phosphate-mannose-protein mannosyltransferase
MHCVDYRPVLTLNLQSKLSHQKSILLIAIPVVISAFTHLWNPIGFPSIFLDEGHYMKRAMDVLEGHSPQEKVTKYDHPYFGQIFLAGFFKIIGYPDSLNPKPGDVHSVEMLYFVPRVLMGIMAVLDTFLVYKIADRLYNRNVAFIASLFFAVMPMTWMLRRIYLDSILLPFLLSSIFFALYYAKRPTRTSNNRNTYLTVDNYNQLPVVILSGIFLGLAIFTKIPVFTMIPLVAYLIYKYCINGDKNRLRILGLWFIPVILIPAIWPAYNSWYGNFDGWSSGILWQTTARQEKPLYASIEILFQIDPVLLILAIAGIVFSVTIRRDIRLLLWVAPLLIFMGLIGFVSFFHFIPLVPAFCIAAGVMIAGISNRLGSDGRRNNENKNQQIMDHYLPYQNRQEPKEFHRPDRGYDIGTKIRTRARYFHSDFAYYGIIFAVGIFGLLCTTILITTNISSAPFEATAFLSHYLTPEDNISNGNRPIDSNSGVVVVSNPIFSWMYDEVFDLNYTFLSPDGVNANDKIDKAIIVVDRTLKQFMDDDSLPGSTNYLQTIFNHTHRIGIFEEEGTGSSYRGYPYTNMRQNFWTDSIEVLANY